MLSFISTLHIQIFMLNPCIKTTAQADTKLLDEQSTDYECEQTSEHVVYLLGTHAQQLITCALHNAKCLMYASTYCSMHYSTHILHHVYTL